LRKTERRVDVEHAAVVDGARVKARPPAAQRVREVDARHARRPAYFLGRLLGRRVLGIGVGKRGIDAEAVGQSSAERELHAAALADALAILRAVEERRRELDLVLEIRVEIRRVERQTAAGEAALDTEIP